MKIISLFLFTGVLWAFRAADTPHRNHFPEPPPTPNRLFYIQRSNNTNTVVYEANLDSNKKLNLANPMNVYWIRYAEQGQRESLSALQWQLVYGYKYHEQGNEVEVNLNAFRKRAIWIAYQEGKTTALTQINGEKAALKKVFVQLVPNSLVPKVHFIELFGLGHPKGKPVYERIYIQ